MILRFCLHLLRSLWFSISKGLGWVSTLAVVCIRTVLRVTTCRKVNLEQILWTPRGTEALSPLLSSILHCKPLPGLHAPSGVLFGGYLGYFSFSNFRAGRVSFSYSSWKQKTGMALKALAPSPSQAEQPPPPPEVSPFCHKIPQSGSSSGGFLNLSHPCNLQGG